MNKNKEKAENFEQGLARLEALVAELEDGQLSLDKSLALFEEGIKLSKQLNRKLDEAEKKLEILLKDEEGRPVTKDWSLESGDDFNGDVDV